MTTSGTDTFNVNRDQIIKAALRKCGAIAAGETPGAQEVADAAEALNAMVKRWDATGIHVWTETDGILFLQPGQISYNLGTGSTDHATETYTATVLSADAAAGATALSVDDITGFSASDYLGIVLNTGFIQWTTVNGAPSGTTITAATALTAACNAGNAVYGYTTPLLRPLRVPSARRWNFLSEIDTPMITLSRTDYLNLPNKYNTGVVTQYYYNPRGGANAAGQMFAWPAPPDATNAIKFNWYRQIQDFNTSANTPDFPQEWIDTLSTNLAVMIGPEYDILPERYALLKLQADEFLDTAMGWDREPESVYFGVNIDRR